MLDRSYLVESIEKLGNKWTSRTGSTKCVLEAKSVEISNEAVSGGTAECKRISPEVPLESDDGAGEHACPDEREGRLPSCKAGVKES